jgi:hypothetical protein
MTLYFSHEGDGFIGRTLIWSSGVTHWLRTPVHHAHAAFVTKGDGVPSAWFKDDQVIGSAAVSQMPCPTRARLLLYGTDQSELHLGLR